MKCTPRLGVVVSLVALASPRASARLGLTLVLSIAVAACREAPRPVDGGADVLGDRADAIDERPDVGFAVEILPPQSPIGVGERRTMGALQFGPTGRGDLPVTGAWSVTDPAVGRMDGSVFEALSEGFTQIVFTFEGRRYPTPVRVVAAPSIVTDPASVEMLCFGTQSRRITAYAVYADGSRRDLVYDDESTTWESSNPTVASVDDDGVVTAGSVEGAVTLTVRLGSVASRTVPVTVSSCERFRGVALDPATASFDRSQRFTVTATLADGTSMDVTSRATLRSNDETVAAFGTGDDANLLLARRVGAVTVTATFRAFTATASARVTAAPVRSITIDPATSTVAVGARQTLRVIGTFSPGDDRDLDPSFVDWSSSDPAIATVSSDGVVTGVSASETEVTVTARARSGDVTGAARVRVR